MSSIDGPVFEGQGGPTYSGGDAYHPSSDVGVGPRRSQRELAAMKQVHASPLFGGGSPPPSRQQRPQHSSTHSRRRTPDGDDDEKEELRQMVAQLQDELHHRRRGDALPQPEGSPPTPTPRGGGGGGRITSQAQFAKMKRSHVTGLRSIGSSGGGATLRQPSPPPPPPPAQHHVSFQAASPSGGGHAGCEPFTSQKEYARRKKGHVITIDSPMRRRPSEVPSKPQQYGAVADRLSPDRRRGDGWPAWPEGLPVNAIQLAQGRWLSTTPPVRSFEVRGEEVLMQGAPCGHAVRLGSHGLAIADACAARMDEGAIEWDNGDVWVRQGNRHGVPAPQFAVVASGPRYGSASPPGSGGGGGGGGRQPPPPQQPAYYANAAEARVGGHGGVHSTQGRCPRGHVLTLQPDQLGDVQCSACELVLPSGRFAGCRVCDYDVCDVCLNCAGDGGSPEAGGPTEVFVQRSPEEGTGAICGPSMLLEEVLAGSPADLAGMAPLLGRKLTHINGEPVFSIAEACNVAQKAATVAMRFV